MIIDKYKNYFWKGMFLDDVIKHFHFTKYLELGIANFETWNNVTCDLKIGVDLNPNVSGERILNCSTNDFFDQNTEVFDLVFIDACHEKSHVKQDFINSESHTKEDGIIIMHDVYPPSASNAAKNGPSGDAFEFWMILVDRYPDNTYVCLGENMDCVGIFTKKDTEIDKEYFNNTSMERGYQYFINNLDKYILSRNNPYKFIGENK